MRKQKAEILYNGIKLPNRWPPKLKKRLSKNKPLPVPYLKKPPKLIQIDLGRQLFVDDFLIEDTTLTRKYHQPEKFEGNPILKPKTEIEMGDGKHAAMSAPFSDGVWYDSKDKLFKMWYHAGWMDSLAYAYSKDGINWIRPSLDIIPDTNIVYRRKINVDSTAVIIDHHTKNAEERYKMLLYSVPTKTILFTSPDGVHWSKPTPTIKTGDRTTFFYNPFRKKWVFSIRKGWGARRARYYLESDEFLVPKTDANNKKRVRWQRVDNLDHREPNWFYAFPELDSNRNGDHPELYNLDAVAYESMMIGLFSIHLGPRNQVCAKKGVPKLCELHVGFSRDGFHWYRPKERKPFIKASRSEGTWDKGYLTSNAALCLVVNDELWFYYTGFGGDPNKAHLPIAENGMYSNAMTGLAKLRRDGFASMNAYNSSGVLLTKTVVFHGKFLFVNTDCNNGVLRVEIVNENNEVAKGFSKSDCKLIAEDTTKCRVIWKDRNDLESFIGKPIKFRFYLENGSLYSFWISGKKTGESNGYLAGGGPLFDGIQDI